jgi:hypothetical protein
MLGQTFKNIFYIPELIGIVASLLLGALWYSPKVLGEIWRKSHGFVREELKFTSLHLIGTLLVPIVTVAVLSELLHLYQIVSLSSAIKLGFLFWLGFVATSHFSGVIWAKKPVTVYFIDVGYLLLMIIMNSILITVWNEHI